MASDGVISDHRSDEQVEKKGNEELKTIEQGGISPSKENNVIEGEENAKTEESASAKAPTESKEVEKTQILTPAIAEAEKVENFDETPDLDVPVTDGSRGGPSPDSKLDISSVPDSVVEAVAKEAEESSNIPDVTESSIEALRKPVELLGSPTKDSVSEEVKKSEEIFVEELNTVEKPESVAEVEVKPQEQFEEVEENYLTFEPNESVDKDITADAGTKADESLGGEVSVMGSKTEEKLKPVVEAGGKPQEVDVSTFCDSIVEAVGKDPEESSKIPDVTESSIEYLHKPLELLESPTNDSETEVGKKLEEVSVEEPKMVEKLESVVEVKVKTKEQSEEVEEKYLTLEPNVSVDKDFTIDAGTKADESLEGEVSAVGPKMEEKPKSVVELGGKTQEAEEEAEEVEEKYEMLKPRESIDDDGGKEGVTQAEESSKEEASLVEPKTLEKSESVVKMGGKTREQAQEVEKKSEMIDPKESLDSDIIKDDLTDLVEEDIKPSESVVSASQGGESGLKEGGIKPVTPDAENVNVDDTKKEVGVQEGKAAVQVGDVEAKKEEKVVNMEDGKYNDVKIEELTQPEKTETIEEKEAKDVKIDENEENGVKKEQLMLPEPTETKDVGGTYTATEVTEKYSNEQSASKDAEITTEEKKEHDDKVDSPDLKSKVDLVESSNFVKEPTSESKESEIEGKVEEAVRSCVEILDKGVAVDESAKSGAPNVELSKIVDNSKTDQDPPKQEAPSKPSQKHSNNIISKVKQSIVKVKKAIIGKSPSSKTLSSESKGDIQTK